MGTPAVDRKGTLQEGNSGCGPEGNLCFLLQEKEVEDGSGGVLEFWNTWIGMGFQLTYGCGRGRELCKKGTPLWTRRNSAEGNSGCGRRRKLCKKGTPAVDQKTNSARRESGCGPEGTPAAEPERTLTEGKSGCGPEGNSARRNRLWDAEGICKKGNSAVDRKGTLARGNSGCGPEGNSARRELGCGRKENTEKGLRLGRKGTPAAGPEEELYKKDSGCGPEGNSARGNFRLWTEGNSAGRELRCGPEGTLQEGNFDCGTGKGICKKESPAVEPERELCQEGTRLRELPAVDRRKLCKKGNSGCGPKGICIEGNPAVDRKGTLQEGKSGCWTERNGSARRELRLWTQKKLCKKGTPAVDQKGTLQEGTRLWDRKGTPACGRGQRTLKEGNSRLCQKDLCKTGTPAVDGRDSAEGTRLVGPEGTPQEGNSGCDRKGTLQEREPPAVEPKGLCKKESGCSTKETLQEGNIPAVGPERTLQEGNSGCLPDGNSARRELRPVDQRGLCKKEPPAVKRGRELCKKGTPACGTGRETLQERKLRLWTGRELLQEGNSGFCGPKETLQEGTPLWTRRKSLPRRELRTVDAKGNSG
uniref:Uncharacterized protein n=1 Tax=Parascaris univalens TaxID=6257 RepID=A0A915CJU8_PARUN